jgi:virginiamycin B lyase
VLGVYAINLPKYIDEYQIPTPSAAPLAITVDRNGMVWFTESNVSKIAQFDPKSKIIHEYSVPGIGDMWGIVVDPRGYVWVTQYSGKGSVNPGGAIVQGGTSRIVRFDIVTKNFTSISLPTLSSFALRLTLDQQGKVWFTELLGNKIGVYDPSSASLQEYYVPTNSSGPADLTFDTKGMLWFSESYARQVGRFDPQSQRFTEYHVGAETASQIVSSPVGIAVDNVHNVWLADHGGNWIVEFNPTTRAVMKYPTHFPPKDVYSIALVNDLLIDNEGRVWFCEHGGNSVGYYAPSTKRMVEFRIPTGPISTTMWLALAPNGDVWFTEWSSNKIGVVHADLLVPVSVNITQDHFKLSAGEKTTLAFVVASPQLASGNGSLNYSWSSYNPREISIGFTPTYPQLGTEAQVQAQLALANRVNPGNYTLALEVSLGDVIISSMVETIITSTQGSTQTPISTELILWAGLLVPLAVIAAIEIRRIRRST